VDAKPESGLAADAQKAKLLVLFSALGLIMFILDTAAGLWLWHYVRAYRVEVPTYDRFLSEVRQSDASALSDLALKTQAKWETCEQARSGIAETVVHMSLSASFIGLALFGLCFLLALWLHRALAARPGGKADPIPPDPVDDIWR
jgi:hypothetical protein